jgi:hypothetical protein
VKYTERLQAIQLREMGYSLNEIRRKLNVSKSSVSLWVRSVELSEDQKNHLREKGFYKDAVERRRETRIANELRKREVVISAARKSISRIDDKQLRLIGAALYWAEGGKTQRLVRFSNGDPEMIKIMMTFFRRICNVPEKKFRGYIHIHPTLDYRSAEIYWSSVSGIPLTQFFKTYRKPNKSSSNKKNSLPKGVMDIYVLDSNLFLTIQGWTRGIFSSY